MADQVLDFQIKVNTDTGALTALGSEFKSTAVAAQGMGDSMNAAATEASHLFQQLLPFAGALGIIAFFKESVTAANEQEEALRRLGFALTANGMDWSANKEKVTSWAMGIQDLTRFSQTEALNALGQLSRATKDVGEAQTAVKVAMGISTSTGKDLNETLLLMQGLMMGTQRSVMMAHKELGTYVGQAKTAQEMLDALKTKFENAAIAEDSYTKSTKEAGHAVDELEKTTGQAFIPTLTILAKALTSVMIHIQDMGSGVSAALVTLATAATGFFKAHLDLLRGHFKQARDEVKKTVDQISAIDLALHDEMKKHAADRAADESAALKTSEHLHAQASARQQTAEEAATAKFKELHATLAAHLDKIGQQTVQKRLDENANLMAAEVAKVGQIKGLSEDQTATLLADIKTLKDAKDANIRNDTANAAKVQMLHEELAKKMDALGVQTLAKQKLRLDIETQMIKDKINKEITSETAKNALLAQADAVNLAQKKELDDKAWDEYGKKVGDTLKQITDGTGQAFAQMIVEGKSFSDSMGQLFKQMIENFIEEILALIVQLIILEVLETSTGVGGVFGQVAGQALKAASRAEGGTNIVDKPTLFLAGEAGPEIASFTPMGKVGRGDDSAMSSQKMGGVGSGGNLVGSPGAGASNVSVGDIYVNLHLASLSSGDRQGMLRQLGDEIRTASVDAIRFSLASQNLANRNSRVAV